MITRPETEASVRRKEVIIECSRESSNDSSTTFHICGNDENVACCEAEFDGQLCWPLTLSNSTVRRLCEGTTDLVYPDEGTVQGKYAYRTCVNGEWLPGEYGECLDAAHSDDQRKLVLAQTMLWIYVVVGAISLISLLIAFYVFMHYRALQCNRITVHRHFVLSFIIRHALLLLILYPHFYLLGSIESLDSDRRSKLAEEFKKSLYYFKIPSYDELIAYLSRNASSYEDEDAELELDPEVVMVEAQSEVAEDDNFTATDAVRPPPLPVNVTDDARRIIEIYLYKLLDSAETYSFLCTVSWMFIEGFYLYYRTIAVFKSEAPFRLFYFIGWGLPAAVTVLWVTMVEAFETESKWSLETKDTFRWITLGPFLAVITANIVFLTHIIFILARKLRSTRAMEMSHTKKAIRGIVLILPLLGITNILFLVDPSGSKVQAMEILYRVANAFLQSSQGFAVAVIYCFTNQEVQSAVKKRWSRYRQTHSIRSRRRSTIPAEAVVSAGTFQNALLQRHSFITPVRNGSVSSRSARFAMEELHRCRLPYRNGSALTNSLYNGSVHRNARSFHLTTPAYRIDNMSWQRAECLPE